MEMGPVVIKLGLESSSRTVIQNRMFGYRTLHYILMALILQFLFTHAQGQGPGLDFSTAIGDDFTPEERVEFDISEEMPPGEFVGTIPKKVGFTYRFNDPPPYFNLDGATGRITTSTRIDRESLESDVIDLVILSSHPVYPLEVRVHILDINDNFPVFPSPNIARQFSETDKTATQIILVTATDADIGINDVTTMYRIVSGNEEQKFKLVVENSTSTPFLYLQNTQKLDRESQESYQLNISARDGGSPPKYGYLIVDITIADYNDHSPVFDESDYSATLNESSPIGTSVVQVRATDEDIGENARIVYSITDDTEQFEVDQDGVVRTRQKPTCRQICGRTTVNCEPNSCVMTVFAHDQGNPPQSGRTYVTVILVDENDHDPEINFKFFPSSATQGTVDEGAAKDAVVAMVTVTDDDEGDNGDTTVRIGSGNEQGHFYLDSPFAMFNLVKVANSGVLDRERISRYNLTMIATDKGTPARTSSAYLIINVNDINDHTPVFDRSEYMITLNEDMDVGSYVLGIHATDNDTGINADITYSILSGNQQEWFKINSKTGLITTQMALDRETASKFSFNVKAEDGGLKFSYATVNITILDHNDETPTFSNPNIKISIEENNEINFPLTTLTASDNDQGPNGTVSYSFTPNIETDYPNTFSIDANTGGIKVLKSLDRETQNTYIITVEAKDNGNPALSSTATVTLNVTDVNDNYPEFYPTMYYAGVLENEPAYTPVTQVQATDPDAGQNAVIYYHIMEGADQKFAINIKTGEISTSERLDRETKSFYRLKISAVDRGDKVSLTPAIVEVTINDVLDTPPEFSEPDGYSFSITEDHNDQAAELDRFVGRVQATSTGTGTTITYTISAGDQNGIFKINPTSGTISTAKKVDRETQAKYTLTVVANGGAVIGSISVDVTVNDLNDMTPMYPSPNVDAYVVENWPIGHEVYLAAAVDEDFGANSQVIYTITGDVDNNFLIDRQTGLIALNKPVTYSPTQTYTIYIHATDSGTPQLSSTLTLNVIVRDVNDHTPVFERTSYDIAISESLPVNTQFYNVNATDTDAGLNGQISYNITHGNTGGHFGIFPDGILYVAQQPDREILDLYVLTLEAKDKGVEPRHSEVNLTIHILDSNDNQPLFVNTSFHMALAENMPTSTYVGSVSATDADAGRNAELSYSFTEERSDFNIHPESGAITSNVVFDRESLISTSGKSQINLIVCVKDNGETRLKDTASVIVTITDKNDHSPEFLQQIYEPSLIENAELNTPVVIVSAQDSDGGVNAQLTYSIQTGNEAGLFSIDGSTGQISLVGELDYETETVYTITVQAQDTGVDEQLTGDATVKITILDFNDNAPQFIDQPTAVNLDENTDVSELVTEVGATDRDTGLNAVITYAIVQGNTRDTFQIDQHTGKIYLAKKLDFEINQKFTLNVTARDQGIKPMTSWVLVIINIIDANDNAPQFTNTAIVRRVWEGVAIDNPVVTLTANDPDSGVNGEVKYSISKQEPSGDYFKIHPDTGLVSTAKQIDRELTEDFILHIMATDQAVAVATRKSTVKVITIIIQDLNDNSPKFVSMSSVAIPDNARQNARVATIKATDEDSSENGVVTYDITVGDASLFGLDELTGNLYLRKNLQNPLLKYTLEITATDKGINDPMGPKSTTFELTVLVTSNSNTGPSFPQIGYTGQVNENEPIGKSVLTVAASYSSNPSATVKYYITDIVANGITQPRYFSVDEISGVVSTAEVLDREAGAEEFALEVFAMDSTANVPTTKSTQVTITLLDKNDSPPEFTPPHYDVTIPENAAPDTTVTTVRATDADKTGSLTYSITAGNDGSFRISSTSGLITTVGTLDRETISLYSLTVRAYDGSQSSFCDVSVNVTDINDEYPQFLQQWYYFDVAEDTRIDTIVARISAMDKDQGQNALVHYRMESEWGRDKFSLDGSTGMIKLVGKLDYEHMEHYIMTMSAIDEGTSPKTSTVSVYVNVLDTNDNTPAFSQSSYNHAILENSTIGTSVTTVTATDKDSGINAEIRYSLIGGATDSEFRIDAESGTIYTNNLLDREAQRFYKLVVKATDQAQPESRRFSNTTEVTVILQDVNDNSPQFISPSSIRVSENSPSGTPVFRVEATDRDDSSNAIIEYRLVTNPGGKFDINPVTGDLKVNGQIDRETRGEYSLNVTATDKGRPAKSAWQMLDVTVRDVNDNPPMFDPEFYSTTIAESVKTGTSLLTVRATDFDIGQNAEIRYFIVGGDTNSDFTIDSHVGELRTLRQLDYERKASYELLIQAQDLGATPLSDTATATITITDINDCAPIFVDSPYKAYVQEHMSDLPVFVMQVTARDDDAPSNAQLRYYIQNQGQDIFRIDPDTGIIKAHQSLDRESQSEYKFTVTATDSGNPRLTGTGTVTVKVQDINDHEPQFARSFYVGHVIEELAPSIAVVQVTANDDDENANAVINYSLVDSISNKFTINSITGQISTTSPLDREEQAEYHLVAIATDGGSIPYTSTVSVTVVVEDRNDNRPKFDESAYSVYATNPIISNSFILGVMATDADAGNNGDIRYSLFGSAASNFQIDPTSGVITAARQLSGSTAIYSLNVRATDRGQNPLTDEATVEIRPLPSGTTNYPAFNSGLRSFNIPEDTNIDYIITQLTGTSPKNGASLSYHIVGGNIDGVFIMQNHNGVLKVKKALDYEAIKVYKLWIQVRDSSTPPLFANTMVTVTISDKNDNPPIFGQLNYNTSVVEGEDAPVTIETVQATDIDSEQNGRIRYSIVGGNTGNEFRIHQETGLIQTTQSLDRETIDQFCLVIQAKDQGSPSLSATSTVDIWVIDVNDQPPRFTSLFITEIPENAPIGSFVIRITSTDADIGQNALVTYNIEENDQFGIDPTSGNVTVIGKLDWESKRQYELQVSGTDDAWRIFTTLNIDVTDVNDMTPQFSQSFYVFDYVELQAEGTEIGTVEATDRDSQGPNSDVYYTLKTATRLFKIDQSTGVISSRASISYKPIIPDNRYQLVTMATDRGDPPKSSEVTVTVVVKEANKYAPVFADVDYKIPVVETAQSGDLIMQITAWDDRDHGTNAEVEYYNNGGADSSYVRVEKFTGNVILTQEVSDKVNEELEINIKAQDKGVPVLFNTTTLTLQITETNRQTPQFTNPQWFVEIPENKAKGSVIATITAVDDDSGANGLVSYYIEDSQLFSIDESQGYITVEGAIDYETSKAYELNITARDRGAIPKEVSRIFTVNLRDINDNPPTFNQTSYKAYVSENSPSGTEVFTAIAVDLDTNPVIKYELSGSTETLDKFFINENTGVIKSQGNIDYEQRVSYTMEVTAINPGTILQNVTTVTVYVLGVNEFIPRFTQPRYGFIVSESADEGYLVGSVLAKDDDSGLDGVVEYFLIGDSNLKGFAINEKTGVITVSTKLDHESEGQIVIEILAKNHGGIHGNDTDTCEVTITIQDANDAPLFTQTLFEDYIREDSATDVQVTQVTANDNDLASSDNQFSYTFLSGNIEDQFTIDSTSGWISLAKELDRETIATYNLTVAAIDSGTPPQTGSTEVKIYVTDVNDNAPYFLPSVPTGKVLEGKSEFSTVIDLSQYTNDLDLAPNQGPYRYTLMDHGDTFSVATTTGIIRTTRVLDRETQAQYMLNVEVKDNGIPTQTSFLQVRVLVSDQNDSPADSRLLKIYVNMQDGVFDGGIVGNVRPLDPDSSGDYQCDIIGGDTSVFSVTSDCNLQSTRVEVESQFALNISGNDGVYSTVYSPVTVHFSSFTQDTVDNTLVLQLRNITIKAFMLEAYQRLVQSFSNVFPDGQTVMLYGFEQSDDDLNLFVAVREQNGGYVYKSVVQSKIDLNKRAMEIECGVVFSSSGFSECGVNQCSSGGECQDVIEINEGYNIYDGPHQIVTSPEIVYTFTCACPEGFTGQNCETRLASCTENPCQHGATCYIDDGNHKCICPPNYTGDTCGDDVNECSQMPCKNTGTCHNTIGSFYCDCVIGYSGKTCEDILGFCQSQPCLNGGLCLNEDSGYTCDCDFGDAGSRCEIASRNFEATSYMEYTTTINNRETNSIAMEFSTVKKNALLLYHPGEAGYDKDFIAIEIIDGKIQFSFNLGVGEVTRMTLQKAVTDGKWYRLMANRNGKSGNLMVTECPESLAECDACIQGDPNCYVSATSQGNNQMLDVGASGNALSIGGIRYIETILDRPGQIQTHDFIGCLRNMTVEGTQLFDIQPRAMNHTSNKCKRQSLAGACSGDVCNNRGVCIDEWATHRCQCEPGFSGSNCAKDGGSFTFGSNAFVQLKPKESYKRDQMLAQSSRKRRAVPATSETKSISMNMRTQKSNGMLFYAKSNSAYSLLELVDGSVRYSFSPDTGVTSSVRVTSVSVADSEWHNISLAITGNIVTITIDNQYQEVEKYSIKPHDFLGIDVQELSIGGSDSLVFSNGVRVSGFDGCMDEFRLNGDVLDFSQDTDQFEIVTVGGVSESCPLTAPYQQEPLSVGIIAVICVIGVVILVTLVIGLIVFKMRRNKLAKTKGALTNKQISNLAKTANDSSRSVPDSGFGDNADGAQAPDEVIIRQHVMNELTSGQYNERAIEDRLPPRPDIIQSRTIPTPLHMGDGTIIIEGSTGPGNYGMDNGAYTDTYDDAPPEHYDIDNASSIAPSDIDIVKHYKGYRAGQLRKYKPNMYTQHLQGQRHGPLGPPVRESPHNLNRQSPNNLLRESPGVLRMQSTPLNRQSPHPMMHPSRHEPGMRQSPMPINVNLARQSPMPINPHNRGPSPMNQLSRVSPHPSSRPPSRGSHNIDLRASPHSLLNNHHGSPIREINDSMSNVSNTTASSGISHRVRSPLGAPNGGPRLKGKGLTLEEINRLNARPLSSPASTADAISSSTEHRRGNIIKPKTSPIENDQVANDDSSSDSHSDDSFTCSEYEPDDEKVRNDMDPSILFLSQLSELPGDNNSSFSKSDLNSISGSLSTLLVSDDESSKFKNKMNGSLNWDYLLNWGPSFEKLVGVFKDIAQLPDTGPPGADNQRPLGSGVNNVNVCKEPDSANTTLNKGHQRSLSREEYV